MSLVELGAVGELVGGVAVLATLLYLAHQVNQTKVAVTSSASQAIYGMAADIGMRAAESDAVVAVIVRSSSGEGPLTPEETLRFGLVQRAVFRTFEFAFLQHRAGVLGDELFQGMKQNVQDMLRSAVIQDWWRRDAHIFSDPFRAYVDLEVERSPGGSSSWEQPIERGAD